MDVTVGVMDEYAGVYVTGCIDVQVVTASGYAAMYELGIVLEKSMVKMDFVLRYSLIRR